MTLKVKYILFIGLIHLIFTGLLYMLLKDNIYWFIASELLILLSLYISVRLYMALIRPLALMKSGIDAIKDEDFNVTFLKTGSRDMDELIDVFNTMLTKLREESVRTEEQAYFLENLIKILPIGIIILDYDDEIDQINPKARKYLGLSEMTESIERIEHPLADGLRDLEDGQTEVISVHGIEKFRCHLSKVFHKGFYRKFIMIEELTDELLKSEKAAFGKVIRIMAHEVNNSIGAVNSILDTVIEFGFSNDDDQADLKESLVVAHERNKSLSDFVSSYADLIKLPSPQRTQIDLVALIDRCIGLDIYDREKRNIDCHVKSTDKSILISADQVLLEQVFVNILKNAKESIGQNGNIRITLQEASPQIVIADDGPGIDPEVADQLFSPFFSTKHNGQGIGLMLIREILNGHDASYSLLTDEDGWTRFRIGF